MKNVNPPTPNNPHIVLSAKVVQELHELAAISAFIDSRLENIEQVLNGFAPQVNEIDMNEVESNEELVDTPLVPPFLDSDSDLDDGEVLNELYKYGNAGTLRRKRIINSFDGDDLAFQYGLESTGIDLVAIVRDVYVFIGSISYVTDFVVLEDIGEFILSGMADVVMGKPLEKLLSLNMIVLRD
ncbi:hypothetical protein Tco_1533607 [Tanacetum coccineum]